jgi:hypothetical protein
MFVTSSPVLSEVIFEAGSQALTRLDALRWAERHDATWLETASGRWRALADEGAPDDERPLALAAEAAGDEFRYAAGLEEADTFLAWLAERGLEVEDWSLAFTRDIALRCACPLDTVGDEIALPVMLADLAATDVLDAAAARLAVRAAVWVEAGAPPAQVPPSPLASPRLPWAALGVSAADLDAVDARLAAIEASFASDLAAGLTPDAEKALLQGHALEWLVLRADVTWWASEDAAREALWCVRDDGLPLAQVAREAGERAVEMRRILHDVPAELHDALLSASPGDTIGPIAGPAGWAVASVIEKHAPSLDEPLVATAARRRLERRLASPLVDRLVRWTRPIP